MEPSNIPIIRTVNVRWDGTIFSCTTFEDQEGLQLQEDWLMYLTKHALMRMNPATLFQVVKQ